MAYINVAEWSPDQVTDWIKGLDDSMYNYVYSFINNGVGGHQLLNIRPYELEQLGMHSIGHQEIVLEAVENLRNFHFNLDKENLQFMALHVATAARCLHRQLSMKTGETMIETQVLNDITRTIATIKPLICWLDRSPFQGQFQFTEICRKMLRLGLEMATIAQRERFVERPVEQIRATAETLERLANYIIQDITDPMLLQPASLNLVTLKKRESELGFNIETSYHGVHRVTDIKHNSPAHNSGKIEDGDEIVQINYQTVVGWQYKTVLLQLRESLPDVLLTLKKRPKHTKIYGQIYMQPYRLPSKKRTIGTRWGENVPSPRPGFLAVPENTFKMPPPLTLNVENEKNDDADTDSICSDILTPTDAKVLEKESRLYYPKPRAMLQRRNTICGDEVLRHKSLGVVPHWIESKSGVGGDPSSPSLRDKSVSFGFGLEINPRPTTCIGISGGPNSKYVSEFSDKKLRQIVEQSSEKSLSSKPGVCKVVRFDATMKAEDYPLDEKYTCNVQNTILETFEPIPFADEEEDAVESLGSAQKKSDNAAEGNTNNENSSNNDSLVETINIPVVVRRGRLDKSHSTPAYDNSGEESDTPPAIEPRKEFLLVTPPVPPPRPKKQHEMNPRTVPIPPPKPPGLMQAIASSSAPQQIQNVVAQESSQPPNMATNTTNVSPHNADDFNATRNCSSSTLSLAAASDATAEGSEIHTPTKVRTLTLKKKHSLISKRRNVNLKILGTGDIQGYLFRRTKDKRGVTFWARLYFVMLDTILYGFRSKEASKANCVIFLPGFTVSLAKEVHSKPFAFKVYHSAKTFYFAAESQDALNQWVEFIRQSTLAQNGNTLNGPEAEINARTLFSENDSSSEENESIVIKNLCTPSPQANKDPSVSSALVSTKTPTSTPISSKSDRRYLGSLRKLTKGSLQFKSSSTNEKKMSNDIPVPTEQFRSYRKVPGGSFGLQIGTNTPGYHDSSLHPFNVSSVNVPSCEQHQQPMQHYLQTQSTQPRQSNQQQQYHPTQQHTQSATSLNEKPIPSHSRKTSSGWDSTMTSLEPPSSPAPVPITQKDVTSLSPKIASTEINIPQTRLNDEEQRQVGVTSPTKSVKKIPYNFIHASNPNLVEFDFQTSRTLDYNMPKINSANAWDAIPTNIQGFVTLKDLMLQKQEEEAQDMYNNRVLLGVEKKEDHKRIMAQKSHNQANGMNEDGGGAGVNQQCEDVKVSKTQSRSLPKPPDYEISFKPDDEDIQLTRTKEGLKLRDFGYELISGDEPLGASSSSVRQYLQTSRQLSQHPDMHDTLSSGSNWTSAMKSKSFLLSSNKLKKNSTSSSCSSADFNLGPGGERRLGSFKKKGKLETFKTSSEKIFQFGKHGSSSGAGTTMTLPLNKKSSNLTSDACVNSSGIKKSQTYNNELKEKAGKYDAQRKNSAPMPIFGKLSFSSSSTSAPNANNKNDNKKDKKNCNSPLFHRALFGHQNNANSQQQNSTTSNTYSGRDYDQEIFSQVVFPKKNSSRKQSIITSIASNDIITAPDVTAPPPPTKVCNANDIPQISSSVPTTTEYPNMECPPVFEPDIYSLDPNASLLLRRNNNNNHSSRENENN
ncbi:connector enhancer of ksr [Musca autumnalis]|uniref:connector enhancer of ksr n=1 Tax=Musca autumnalis TaxID=221902 RepID=UPI003CF99820